jgi:hypothetical protein
MANLTINQLPDGGAMQEGDTLIAYRDGQTNQVSYDGLVEAMVDTLYPVGSIYISVNSTDPEDIFPGSSWQPFGRGRVLVGVGEGADSANDTLNVIEGTAGGFYQHTLLKEEMPEHKHEYSYTTPLDQGNVDTVSSLFGVISLGDGITVAHHEDEEIDSETDLAGGNQPHNNVQPWIAVYMWERI